MPEDENGNDRENVEPNAFRWPTGIFCLDLALGSVRRGGCLHPQLRGAAGLSGYCATKGGVRLFAKAIAMECATFGDGIRVNSVHPGIIDTPIWGKIPTEATGAGQNAPIDPEERAKLAAPLGRAGHAEEIAQGVLYLASDASRYVTGTELVIDGGMNAGGVVRRA